LGPENDVFNWPGPLEINRQIADLTLDKEMLQEVIRRKL
jgi:hypothetical protein